MSIASPPTLASTASSTSLHPLVELRNVSKKFGDKVILDDVSLQINAGDAIGIIGPSGTGKSTILRIISGLLAPDSGEIYVGGQRREALLGDNHAPEPVQINLVFQQAALFDSLTVAENVGFSLFQHSNLPKERIREIVDEALERVGLPGTGDRYPSELSGGMRKRVSFARAVLQEPGRGPQEPELLLYDEPTAGLDPIASTVMENLMRELSQGIDRCATYMVVTHQDSTIRRTADRVVFLYEGKIQWQGPVDNIDHTDNPYVRQFFSSAIQGPIRVAS